MSRHPDYNQARPYRDRIVQIHRAHGMMAFAADNQFWTLGGPAHCEFIELNKHFEFGPRSYHTVDRGPMKATDGIANNCAIVTYPNSEFGEICNWWDRPLAISYDSTEIIISNSRLSQSQPDHRHDRKIISLAELALAAMRSWPGRKLFVHANYMVAYAGTRSLDTHGGFFADDYIRWTSIFVDWLRDYDVSWPGGVTERMAGSLTDMVDFHFVIDGR